MDDPCWDVREGVVGDQKASSDGGAVVAMVTLAEVEGSASGFPSCGDARPQP